ncbi:MAG: hypothetical protein CEE38_05010 [Planctomycetes bacterium B3_Pla]|nr:MAG: hypothetical protein CEE38_05010 [Planctomycetes bacterium B3_Pla]
MPTYSVITTIAEPSKSVRELVMKLSAADGHLVVVGDQKGPDSYDTDVTTFFSLEAQAELDFKLANKLPTCHYARKNVGYLYAIGQNADCIYETDDDNAPLAQWKVRPLRVEARALQNRGWVNVFRYFTDELIWPRGFPLDSVRNGQADFDISGAERVTVEAPIQQALADNSPDVDATWRLLHDKGITFDQGPSIYLGPGAWCPINSQSTWWWPQVYPLMYLPSFCTFRMTDIWRGFIAQRCLWEMGSGVVFHASEVYQDRNAHNLMQDFEDEIPGYLGNRRLAAVLDALSLKSGVGNALDNLVSCYEALIKENFFPSDELALVKAWAKDIERIT